MEDEAAVEAPLACPDAWGCVALHKGLRAASAAESGPATYDDDADSGGGRGASVGGVGLGFGLEVEGPASGASELVLRGLLLLAVVVDLRR